MACRAVGPDWEANDDMRSRWFNTVRRTLLITEGNLRLFDSHFVSLTWWKTIEATFSAGDMSWVKSEAPTLYKFTLLHATYSTMEECLRRITESYDAKFMSNRRSISAITNHLCDRLSLRRYKKLFRLVSLVRNTIHNNGHYRPDDSWTRKRGVKEKQLRRQRRHERLTWRARQYDLRFGQVAEFVNWTFIVQHIEDMVEVMFQRARRGDGGGPVSSVNTIWRSYSSHRPFAP